MTTTVQTNASTTEINQQTNHSLAWPATPTADNLLVAIVGWHANNSSVAAPTATGYTRQVTGDAAWAPVAIFYRVATGDANDDFTATFGTACNAGLVVWEQAPSAGKVWRTADLITGSTFGSESSTTSTGTGTVATDDNDCYLAAGLSAESRSNNADPTVDNSFAVVDSTTISSTSLGARYVSSADRTVTATGSYSTTFSWPLNASLSQAGLVAFAMEASAAAPDVPTGVTATATGYTTADVADYTVAEATSHDGRWSVQGAATWTTVIGIGAEPWAVTGLDWNTDYEFQVRAVNVDGTSDWSTSATASTPEPPYLTMVNGVLAPHEKVLIGGTLYDV